MHEIGEHILPELKIGGEYEITFGKHKGEMVKDVPVNYLKWALKEGAGSENFLMSARMHLDSLVAAE